MTNYIHQLQEDVATLRARLAALEAGIRDLRIYLQSSKFYVDTTVQATDVLYRLGNIESESYYVR